MAAEAGADNDGVLWKVVDGDKPCVSGDVDDEKKRTGRGHASVGKVFSTGLRGGLQPFSAPLVTGSLRARAG